MPYAPEFFEGDLDADDETRATPDGGARCKHCQKTGLDWVHTGERWRLMEDTGEWHTCGGKPVTADEFPTLP